METNEIKKILERYWQCETSIEEERILKTFFSQESIPADFSEYISLFDLKKELAKVTAPSHLNDKLKIGHGSLDTKKQKINARFYPILRIAASVLIIVSAGIGINTQYSQGKYMDELMSDTYTNPEDAIQDTREALVKISSTLSKGQNFLLNLNDQDSIQQNQKANKE